MKINQENLGNITRKDFPMFLDIDSTNNKFIYLDHAATSQKPKLVLDAVKKYYEEYNANVHRGAHKLSALATEAFEESRLITAEFIHSKSSKEIIFTRNATESINLVARSWGDNIIKKGDEILLSLMEHHSNIVPWQLLAKRTGCIVKYVKINRHGIIDIDDLKSKITRKTRLVSLVHISNVLGCCNPIKEIAEICHKEGALILLDACQSLAHQVINVQELDIDFLAGSSHKLCGPTGVGFLWAREEILTLMPPFMGGGEMIQDVYLEGSSWAEIPHKFEAGTPPIGEAIGMGKALTYLRSIGLNTIQKWESELTKYLFEGLSKINEIHVLGPSPDYQSSRGALATFTAKNLHSNDIAELLNENKIFIRSGHHCCQPLHRHYSLNATARASLSFTSTFNEIDTFLEELKCCIKFLNKFS